ncbi:tonB-system energizer ExbB [Methylocapsa sp. S129]|uniref:tonB-system energizer ExbB n=1 Tax=Methylocapsa sp. S129 TaxID=1641869 RepID=UPI00131DC6AE|nr:tonB-system energizer ExbB [Methylocapsa sp. S129]
MLAGVALDSGSTALGENAATASTQAAPTPATAPAANAAARSSAAPDLSTNPAAPSPAAPSPATAIASLPHDLSPWSMFMNADIIVKAVMVGLAFASLVTWTVWLAKGLELVAAKRKAKSATRKLERANNLSAATREIEGGWTRRGAVADLVQAAVRETKRSSELSAEGIKERLSIALSRIEARAGRNMARGTGLLATIGATAPFVGLFGTVWGIMNAFIGISQSHTTNLAVVAPGIAEALLATAIGLVAAIPAVIIYNIFARSIAGFRALLSDASGEVLQHLSRDLERQQQVGGPVSTDLPARSSQAERSLPRAVAPALRTTE